MTSQHLISVVLATYNGELYLQQQLESISAQSRPPDELIVGDDGSQDRTTDILAQFKEQAPFPVMLIQRERQGLSPNFLLSTELSHGDLIAFSDQDDVWLPNKLERSLQALDHYAADLVIHGATTVDEELRPKRTGYRNIRSTRVDERFHGNPWRDHPGNSMLFRKTLLDGCNWVSRPTEPLYDRPLTYDYLVALLASVRGRTVRLPERLLLYRQHGTNVAAARLTGLQRVHRYMADNPWDASIQFSVNVFRDYAEYFSNIAAPEHRKQTVDYFLRAGEVQRSRAKRLHNPAWRGIPLIGAAALRGDYSLKTGYGLSWGSFLRDLYTVTAGRHQHGDGSQPRPDLESLA
jgi:glycosyltransferase involved in cell wall biosynthesis